MLRKAADIELPAPDWSKLTDAAERKLAIRCAIFPEAIQKAARELDSSTVASYLLDLAKDFSTFYRNCPVLNAEDPSLKAARLQLSARVRDILRTGLSALTINTLESM
jgi:arginyl-tRNA synthetase